MLLVPDANGLDAFSDTTTLAVDSNRVTELDGAGEATWSLDTVSWPAQSRPAQHFDQFPAPSRRSGPINKPSRARYTDDNEILVVNSGANQVCKIDRAGGVGYIPGECG